jgi:hypothetical protein
VKNIDAPNFMRRSSYVSGDQPEAEAGAAQPAQVFRHLPIVFTGRRRNKLIVLAVGIVLMGIGIMMTLDQGGSLVGGAGPFRRGVLPSQVGWMVCGLGLVLAVVALLQLVRGCPRLELNDEGILYGRCLQSTRIAWSELDRAGRS